MVSEGYLNCDVAAGKKANDSISIGYDTLMLYGIFEIADIEIGFDISDDDYNHTYTGPRTILTTAADGYDYDTPVYRENIASKESQAEYDYSVPYFSTDTVYEESGLVIASQAVWLREQPQLIGKLLPVMMKGQWSTSILTAPTADTPPASLSP